MGERSSLLLLQIKNALMGNIEKLQRPVRADEEQAKALEEDESRFLSIALVNFRRCLMADNQYDLAVVFRLCQLWFRLASHTGVNEKIWYVASGTKNMVTASSFCFSFIVSFASNCYSNLGIVPGR